MGAGKLLPLIIALAQWVFTNIIALSTSTIDKG
jgi:hypothetical protein